MGLRQAVEHGVIKLMSPKGMLTSWHIRGKVLADPLGESPSKEL